MESEINTGNFIFRIVPFSKKEEGNIIQIYIDLNSETVKDLLNDYLDYYYSDEKIRFNTKEEFKKEFDAVTRELSLSEEYLDTVTEVYKNKCK
jgi:hypothetical protein